MGRDRLDTLANQRRNRDPILVAQRFVEEGAKVLINDIIAEGGARVRLPCHLGDGVAEGDEAILSVRPENVRVLRENGSEPCLEGEVLQVIFLGNCIDCRVRWRTFEWKVLTHSRMRLRKGETVYLRPDPEHSLAVRP